MKHPLFNVDFSRLNIKYPPNLLPDDKLTSLRQEYVSISIRESQQAVRNCCNAVCMDYSGNPPLLVLPFLDLSRVSWTTNTAD